MRASLHVALFSAKFLRYAGALMGRPKASAADRERWRAVQQREKYLRSLTPFERELLESRCPRHSNLAVCDQCCTSQQRDSTGFPGAMFAAGRGRYRLCSRCEKLQGIGDWNFVARSCHTCAGTSGAPEGGAVSPIAKPATLPRLRRITRS